VLAAFEQRAARVPPDGQKLGLLVGARLIAGAFERPWQQRMRERLARDALGVEHV
jgi:hypothetical protein